MHKHYSEHDHSTHPDLEGSLVLLEHALALSDDFGGGASLPGHRRRRLQQNKKKAKGEQDHEK